MTSSSPGVAGQTENLVMVFSPPVSSTEAWLVLTADGIVLIEQSLPSKIDQTLFSLCLLGMVLSTI